MALQLTIVSSTGLEIRNAYIKIDEYSCHKDNRVSARIRGYVSKHLEEAGNAPIEGSEDIIELKVDYSEQAKNTKKQIYEFMKSLDRYADALDVLENEP